MPDKETSGEIVFAATVIRMQCGLGAIRFLAHGVHEREVQHVLDDHHTGVFAWRSSGPASARGGLSGDVSSGASGIW